MVKQVGMCRDDGDPRFSQFWVGNRCSVVFLTRKTHQQLLSSTTAIWWIPGWCCFCGWPWKTSKKPELLLLASYRRTLKQYGFVRLGLVPELLPQGAIKGSFIVGWIMAQRAFDTVCCGTFEVSSWYLQYILPFQESWATLQIWAFPTNSLCVCWENSQKLAKLGARQSGSTSQGTASSVAVGSTNLNNIGTKCASHCRQELLSKQRAQKASEEISEVFAAW